MKTKSLLLFVILFGMSVISYAQALYQKGYYITNEGEKIEGLILNEVWDTNPTSFRFKQNDYITKLTLDDVKEFGVENKYKYVRDTVDVEISSFNQDKLEFVREPNLEEKVVFLKQIIEDYYSLFEYKNNNIAFFYYTNYNSQKATYLVFKKYLVGDKILSNNTYQQQILSLDKCGNINKTKIAKELYNRENLIKYFELINQCEGLDSSSQEKVADVKTIQYQDFKRPRINIKAKIGLTQDQVNVYRFQPIGVDFDKNYSISPGIEIEVPIKSNNNTVSLLVEPSYYSFDVEKIRIEYNNVKPYRVKHSGVRIPIGLRRYFHLNPDNSLYLSSHLIADIKLNTELYSETGELHLYDWRRISQLYFCVSGGYRTKYGLSAEIRAYSKYIVHQGVIGANILEFSIKYKLF